MSEEAARLTRSQKRALERDPPGPAGSPEDGESKRVKLETGDPAAAGHSDMEDPEEDAASEGTPDPIPKVPVSLLKTGEVKATIKVEVQTGDEPVDMSTAKSEVKKERQPPSPDDVIVLSDNEPASPLMNGHCFTKTDTDKLMKSSPEERVRIIKQLKEELRLQEAKLVLLKKLRQSQIQKESTVQKATGRSSGTVIPPPLVRGATQHVPSKPNSQIAMPPLLRGAQPIAVTPQQIASLRQQQQQHSGSGPPPLLLAPRASVPNVQAQGQRIIQQGLLRVASVANNNVMVNIPQASPTHMKGSNVNSNSNPSESPAARQAAAKLALRKQLEKTLLEIPPPKPPAPEFNFLPSAANNEFIYLLGLEEVVQKLLEMHGRGSLGPAAAMANSLPKEPHTCLQCKTDFTSRWRQEKAGTVLCDQCMSSNQKKALKAEHTNRLKAAFVKALQQEQEIEQRILQQAASSAAASSSSSSSVSKTTSPSLSKSEQQILVNQQYKQVRAAMQQQQHHHQQQQQQQGPPPNRWVAPRNRGATFNQGPGAEGFAGMGGVAMSAPPCSSGEVHPVLEKLRTLNNYNPKDFDWSLKNGRVFIIKSYSEDDIHRSIKYSIWCSTEHGNKRLDGAYRSLGGKGPLYLLFSVNGSGHFCGVAEMRSAVDYNAYAGVWSQDKWKGKFEVRWAFVKDVPNNQLRHIRLENNDNKPVTNSRDTQEVPLEKAKQVLKIIATFKHTTSIFDDFAHYESRQEEEEALRRERNRNKQ